MKRKKKDMSSQVDLFICTHKNFEPKVSSEVYKVVHGNNWVTECGNLQVIDCYLDDEMLDDRFWSELYMYKWVAKNWELKKYVGFCHYRRYWWFLDDIPDFDKYFKDHGAIAVTPKKFNITVLEQYERFHNSDDLLLCGDIIREKAPQYEGIYSQFIKQRGFFPFNMLIMKKDDFLAYMEFMNTILDTYVDIVGTDIYKRIKSNREFYLKSGDPGNKPEYQYRIGSFLGERLTNVFLMKNFKKICAFDWILTEKKYKNEGEGDPDIV